MKILASRENCVEYLVYVKHLYMIIFSYYIFYSTLLDVFSSRPSVILTSNISNKSVVYINSSLANVTLTCKVLGGSTLSWENGEFIGQSNDGSRIEFAYVEQIGITKEGKNVIAVLTDTGINYLISELTLTISNFNLTKTTFICSSGNVTNSVTLHCKYIE